MLGIVVWTGLGAGTIAIFINAPSLIIVFVFALLFSIAGTKNLKSRVHNFADGAVLGGWIGLLIGGMPYSTIRIFIIGKKLLFQLAVQLCSSRFFMATC